MRRHNHLSHRRRHGFLAAVMHTFRERQIYLRAEGEVQFITLKPWVQVGGLSALLVALFWLAFSSISVVFKDQLLALNERGMYDARLEYEDRIAAMRNEVDRLNDRLLINQGEYLGRVDQVKSEFDGLVERHRRLVEFFRHAMKRLAAEDGEPIAVEAPELRPSEEIPADSHDDETGLEGGPLAPLKHGMFAARYTAPFRTAAEAAQPLAEIEAMFTRHRQEELALLDEALDHAESRAQRAREIFNELGIDDRAVVAASDLALAAGGPLISLPEGVAGEDELARRMEEMLAAHDAFEKMQHEARELPLRLPLRNVRRLTSGYGVRRDPFRHTIAMHSGVDFRSDLNSPVYATADGRVNVAGWEGAYGRMVEIIHDNGVSTRYAHLSSITVAAGDKVKRGDMVGRLGNTGRSTGPHLHYETRVKGRAVDPAKFWQVSNAVQELSKKD